MRTLVLIEHDRGRPTEASLEAVTVARDLGDDVEAVIVGAAGEGALGELGPYGVRRAHLLRHPLLDDYGPECWGEALAQLTTELGSDDVTSFVAAGTERGNEVMAQTAARLGAPLAANCVEVTPGDPWRLVRLRWGGSLLEEAELTAQTALLTLALHSREPATVDGSAPDVEVVGHEPDIPARYARTTVTDRVTRDEGVTLATAPVVVAGGRGVGGPEGFAVLEELAGLLGGAVGCSRVATNAGWRPHSDQVGQTGTQVAPDLYIACGISGAIQHWVGCMNAKNILAINTDPEAPLVTRAGHAVIGDLHGVLEAVVAEVRARRDA